jgi:predicted peptidase
MLKNIARFIAFSLIFVTLPLVLRAQKAPTFDHAMYQTTTDTLPYRILFPINFDPAKKYPVIFFLHGSGERGNDNEAQLKYGASLFLKDSIRQNFPAIVIFPQCPKNSDWSDKIETKDSTGYEFTVPADAKPTRAMHALIGLVTDFLDKPYVNKRQVYIGGLSMGGFGTFEILSREPKIFAAAITMAGGGNSENAKKYAKRVPMWIFHGAKDNTVKPEHSEIMVDAIKSYGGDPKFTLYPNDGHDCWDDGFAEPELLPWLFAQKK